MSKGKRDERYEITWLIRRVFRSMSHKADEYLSEFGLTAADRAVMEFLYPGEKLTVPEIASRYQVSRQHVQVTVNALLAKDLLRKETNPQHRRSQLVQLSDDGVRTFADIRIREASLIEEVFSNIPQDALTVTHQTLTEILDRFQQRRIS